MTSEGSTCFLFFFGDGGEGARKKEEEEKNEVRHPFSFNDRPRIPCSDAVGT